jgi:hypothetical protein
MLCFKFIYMEFCMYAIEFETEIDNGVVRIPEAYPNLNKVHAKVIIMTQDKPSSTPFNPRLYFGAANQTKQEIDAYLNSARDGWL